VTPEAHFDHVIFLSEHAVTHAGLRGAGLFGRSQWYAIGGSTAAALDRVRFDPQRDQQIIVPGSAADANSEGLLKLPELQRLAGQRVLLVAGEGGRDLLLQQLGLRGAEVMQWQVYRRVPIATVEIDASKIDVCVASSGAGLKQLTALWLTAGGGLNTHLCTPSQRVASVAVELGWQRVMVGAGAGVEAVAAVLTRLGSA
jgi:uroporphyrinogen-III synthase